MLIIFFFAHPYPDAGYRSTKEWRPLFAANWWLNVPDAKVSAFHKLSAFGYAQSRVLDIKPLFEHSVGDFPRLLLSFTTRLART
jgi:hypothetical protein